MSHRFLVPVAVGLGLAAATVPALAQEKPPMQATAAADLKYEPIEVPGFASGMEIAVLQGDFTKADQPYTLRLRFPDGYRFPPHWHPRAENVTVLEGTFRLAMGRAYDAAKLKTYHPGDFLYIRPENPHFGMVQGRTVVQLHGVGPFEIHVVEGQEMSSR